jgi:hypothetical protein
VRGEWTRVVKFHEFNESYELIEFREGLPFDQPVHHLQNIRGEWTPVVKFHEFNESYEFREG